MTWARNGYASGWPVKINISPYLRGLCGWWYHRIIKSSPYEGWGNKKRRHIIGFNSIIISSPSSTPSRSPTSTWSSSLRKIFHPRYIFPFHLNLIQNKRTELYGKENLAKRNNRQDILESLVAGPRYSLALVAFNCLDPILIPSAPLVPPCMCMNMNPGWRDEGDWVRDGLAMVLRIGFDVHDGA